MSPDYAAAFFSLMGIYLIGRKNIIGFIFNFMACIIWAYVAYQTGLWGLLIEVIPLAILNVIAYKKWGR